MDKNRDYHQDLAEIKLMMQKSSKFLSISGWSGIMAGIYALIGAYIANKSLDFNSFTKSLPTYPLELDKFTPIVLLAIIILILAFVTSIIMSWQRANKVGEKIWNPTSKKLLLHLSIPLITGGILMIQMLHLGFIALLPTLSLVFYGIALYQAGQFTFREIRILGLLQIVLGIIGLFHLELGLLLWAIGFGVLHIVYGLLVHLKYQK
jgi:hypothetical protein